MATICPLSSIEEATFNTAIKMAFSTFLHCSEFKEKPPTSSKAISSMKLTRGDVVLLPNATNPTHACLTIPLSKSDPFQKGVSVLIATAPHAATCTVHILQHLYSIDPQPPPTLLFLGLNGCQLLHSTFIAHLNLSLSVAGMSSQYTSHSFRWGTASVTAAGFSDYEIQLLSHGHSDAYRLYINVPHDCLLHLSAWLHWAVPDTQPFTPPELHFTPTLA